MQRCVASKVEVGSGPITRSRPSAGYDDPPLLQAHPIPTDQAAIRHIAAYGGTLCTLVHIEGSYSRRIGAQLAVAPDGSTAGDLADHCLERELIHRASLQEDRARPELLVYGKGSPFIDFQLPCGSTIHLLLDPAPNQNAARHIVSRLDARRPAFLELPRLNDDQVSRRQYLPLIRVIAFGEGPEAEAMRSLASAYGAEVVILPAAASAEHLARVKRDPWTAIVFLSHDHEWERISLPWALESEAFYVGAIGGARACEARLAMLEQVGVPSKAIERLNAPIGLFPSARHPAALALSAFAEIAAAYEDLVDE